MALAVTVAVAPGLSLALAVAVPVVPGLAVKPAVDLQVSAPQGQTALPRFCRETHLDSNFKYLNKKI